MSLDTLRSERATSLDDGLKRVEKSHRAWLEQLWRCSALLNGALGPKQPHEFNSEAAPSDDEQRFLNANDIAQGRYFQESTLPDIHYATSQPPVATSSTQLPHPASPTRDEVSQPQQSSPTEHSASSTAPLPKPSSQKTDVEPEHRFDAQALSEDTAARISLQDQPSSITQQNEPVKKNVAESDEPSFPPEQIVPPTIADQARAPIVMSPSPEVPESRHRPKTLHLPPREEQLQRLHEVERLQDVAARREQKEDEKLGVAHNHLAELASSPSSTVGPYSTATPRPSHHSPDTSLDEEIQHHGIATRPVDREATPKALQPPVNAEVSGFVDPIAPKTRTALTPDAQLRQEEEQAVRHSRDARNHAAGNAPPDSLLSGSASEVSRNSGNADDPAATSTGDDTAMVDSSRSQNVEAPSQERHTDTVPKPKKEDQIQDQSFEKKRQSFASDQHSHPLEVSSLDRRSIQSQLISPLTGGGSSPELAPNAAILGKPFCEEPSALPGPKTPISSVVFAKQSNKARVGTAEPFGEAFAALRGAAQDENKDYLIPLFTHQAHQPPNSQSLVELLHRASKVVTTTSQHASIREMHDNKILKRVYTLQNSNKWSLRQIEKTAEPPRPRGPLDIMLREMKWMRTDFKEEKKWRQMMCQKLAATCAEWVTSTPDRRATLQVRVRRRASRPSTAVSNRRNDQALDRNGAEATPELSPSGQDDSDVESPPELNDFPTDIFGNRTPAALFSLGREDVILEIDGEPSEDGLLKVLPEFRSLIQQDSDSEDAAEPAVIPVSKMITGKLVSTVSAPPRKRSRYEYEEEPERPSSPNKRLNSGTSTPSTPSRRFRLDDLPPEMTDVALFSVENRHVRDRLHASHAFRPPTEFNMPSTSFFEARSSSQWLWDEDQKLRALVKDYSFNWSLIADTLSVSSRYPSGAERRTPWECFERWVQLEGLPAEMSKTQYFRTYQSRLEAAHRTVAAHNAAAQQQMQQQAQTPGSAIGTPLRRRTTQPFRVERRRNNRYLAIIDGMRKLARKRESAAHKQAEAAKAAALRKQHEPAQVKTTNHTPQEFSRLKWEREKKQAEYHAHMLRQQQQAHAAQKMAAQGMPNNQVAQQRPGTAGSGSGSAQPGMSNTNAQVGHPQVANMQARMMNGHPHMQNIPNGAAPQVAMGMPGVPQAQMQMNMQNHQRMSSHGSADNSNMPMQYQQQQRNMQMPNGQQHYQMQPGQQMNGQSYMGNGMQTPAMLAQMHSMNNAKLNGIPMQQMNGLQGNASSPRMAQPNLAGQPQSLSNGVIPQISKLQAHVQQRHPQYSQEQVRAEATKMMRQMSQQQALATASGSMGSTQNQHMSPSPYQQPPVPNMTGGSASPQPVPGSQSQQYQQQLRQQMLQQQQSMLRNGMAASSPQLQNATPRPPSRSATPQNPQQQGMSGGQQSPGQMQAQMARK